MSAEDQPHSETIATLRIDLIDSDPPIWREIEVPLAMTLKQLHRAIQAAMEWRTRICGSSPSVASASPAVAPQG
jgi:hypothetical protein